MMVREMRVMLESESESESEKLLKKYKKEKMEGKYRPSWDRYLGSSVVKDGDQESSTSL